MMWTIRFEKRAKKDLYKIPQQYQKRIFSVLPILQLNPYVGKKLEGELKDYFGYRVWPYRIIYKIFKKILLIFIVRIGHRQGVYK